MSDILIIAYPWVKALHVMAVLSWMAGLFYLPRLFVYHAERATRGDQLDETLQVMEHKLLRFIMNPAMVVAWVCGLIMVFTPGIVGWDWVWPWTKGAAVLAMTWFHHWAAKERKVFAKGTASKTGRQYRMMNELPTLFMVVIVLSVIVKF
ncbi:protoporphyrinogen oxidase HemJ [Pseudoprimorskyibacter insulae]|uniref:Protoporphyrinogen IX oxidase n=1 Tax=Pseudoprimorskyibacter insulae TaxID=1695997 RepID=A0A2R8ATT7_9RHOB|nr:protoporphyrinogen oxidase HemJ [Pseudoprimorskyibacter insulae]SPF79445.1 hypothetical protein PRI8871_01241 [Pseudoprimorskyibacter insulae]